MPLGERKGEPAARSEPRGFPHRRFQEKNPALFSVDAKAASDRSKQLVSTVLRKKTKATSNSPSMLGGFCHGMGAGVGTGAGTSRSSP